MPNVYLKNSGTVEVALEELENYLHENADKIGTRRKKLRRPTIGKFKTSAQPTKSL